MQLVPLALATQAYQASLESLRSAQDMRDEFIAELEEDVRRARVELEVAFARHEMRSM